MIKYIRNKFEIYIHDVWKRKRFIKLLFDQSETSISLSLPASVGSAKMPVVWDWFLRMVQRHAIRILILYGRDAISFFVSPITCLQCRAFHSVWSLRELYGVTLPTSFADQSRDMTLPHTDIGQCCFIVGVRMGI